MTTVLIAASFLVCFAEEDIVYHDNADDAVAVLREAMKQRRSDVTIGLLVSTDEDGLKQVIGRMLKLAAEHTGKPDEGDYINFQYESYKGEAHTTHYGVSPAVEVRYDLTYYDDAEQEAEVSKKIVEALVELDLGRKTDYEKLLAIHDYICRNTEYVSTEDVGETGRTAYGALVNGKAVCQGYCVLLYRMLLEAGIDNRVIFGTGVGPDGTTASHTWNIVDIYGDYYYVDITWDDAGGNHDYFMVPAGAGFEDEHIAGEEFGDRSFVEKYMVTTKQFRGDVIGTVDKIMWAAEDIGAAIEN